MEKGGDKIEQHNLQHEADITKKGSVTKCAVCSKFLYASMNGPSSFVVLLGIMCVRGCVRVCSFSKRDAAFDLFCLCVCSCSAGGSIY